MRKTVRISVERDRSFKGVWIPREIYLDESLSLMEKLVLAEICSLDRIGGCFAMNKHFADFCGVTPERASQIIRMLRDKGYVDTTYEKKGNYIAKRIIRPTVSYEADEGELEGGNKKNFGRVTKKILVGNKKNYEEKNTIKNTIKNTCVEQGKPKIPPPLDELDEYIQQYSQQLSVVPGFSAQKFYDYYAQQGWRLKNGRPMKDWRAAVRLWLNRQKDNTKDKRGVDKYKTWERRK